MTDKRYDDSPFSKKIKLAMDIINRIGFPIVVCVWLAYQQFTQGKIMVESLQKFTQVLESLKMSVDQQTKALRHGNIRNDKRDRSGADD